MTKLTSDTALSETPQIYIKPPMSVMIMEIVRVVTKAAVRFRPISTKVTRNIVSRDIETDFSVSIHIVRYCS
ncbi:unnamed protein product [Nesidiocoris tenuis]|uniref:Uncharacterized protein n=1 Tax=Nesidiocoris tenuis TaxID=355587 RepID=A0A6H5G372_9HEMI|nr:unnamed protein product [Nesidiocoris tenuis]